MYLKAYQMSKHCTMVCNGDRILQQLESCQSGNYFIFNHDDHKADCRNIVFMLQSNLTAMWQLANTVLCQMTLHAAAKGELVSTSDRLCDCMCGSKKLIASQLTATGFGGQLVTPPVGSPPCTL